jgi:hypothetical protein
MVPREWIWQPVGSRGSKHARCESEGSTNPEHQFVFTVGGTTAIGGTGLPQIAAPFSTLTPTMYIGKGFADLPDSMAWLRPLTISATAAVAVPTQNSILGVGGPAFQNLQTSWTSNSLITQPPSPGNTTLTEIVNPKILQLGFALEWSLVSNEYTGPNRTGTRYPEGWVLVEFTTLTPLNGPLAGKTTGTVNPGVIWVSRYLQVAAEAILPMDAHSGRDVGARKQAHLYQRTRTSFPGGSLVASNSVSRSRTLSMDPKGMLFDEPTSALDPEVVGEVPDVVVSLANEGMTTMCVTHVCSFCEQSGHLMDAGASSRIARAAVFLASRPAASARERVPLKNPGALRQTREPGRSIAVEII